MKSRGEPKGSPANAVPQLAHSVRTVLPPRLHWGPSSPGLLHSLMHGYSLAAGYRTASPSCSPLSTYTTTVPALAKGVLNRMMRR